MAAPTGQPALTETPAQLADLTVPWRAAGERVALVPTMGALHEGHVALVRSARNHAARVVVSVFVNPTQFGPNEDFSRYPRDLAADRTMLAGEADAVYAPTVATMYPHGFSTRIEPGALAEPLCGQYRPGHFAGVATVVTKLLMQTRPDVALFGEKDFQQLAVIRRVVADLDVGVAIIGVPTVREADGLALSSRNRYLRADERALAPELHKSLQAIASGLRPGEPPSPLIASEGERLKGLGFVLDYLDYRASDDLSPLSAYDSSRPGRLFVAARLGSTRLIDNVMV